MNLNSAITESGTVTALYCRLSCDDDNEGDPLQITLLQYEVLAVSFHKTAGEY